LTLIHDARIHERKFFVIYNMQKLFPKTQNKFVYDLVKTTFIHCVSGSLLFFNQFVTAKKKTPRFF